MEEVKAGGAEAMAVKTDVADAASVQALIKHTGDGYLELLERRPADNVYSVGRSTMDGPCRTPCGRLHGNTARTFCRRHGKHTLRVLLYNSHSPVTARREQLSHAL